MQFMIKIILWVYTKHVSLIISSEISIIPLNYCISIVYNCDIYCGGGKEETKKESFFFNTKFWVWLLNLHTNKKLYVI